MPGKNSPLRDLFNDMLKSKLEHIERLLRLKDAGVTVGAPTMQDIIDRETTAIDNLRRAIATLDQSGS